MTTRQIKNVPIDTDDDDPQSSSAECQLLNAGMRSTTCSDRNDVIGYNKKRTL